MDFIAVLEQILSQNVTKSDDRALFSLCGQHLILLKPKLDKAARQNLQRQLLSHIDHNDPFKYVLINSLAGVFTDDDQLINRALEKILTVEWDAEVAVSLILTLSRQLWMDQEESVYSAITRADITHMWRGAVNQFRSVLAQLGLQTRLETPVEKRIVIVTQQLLGQRHAPSLDAYEFAHMLQNDFGKQVLIINSIEFGKTPLSPLQPAFIGNVVDEWQGVRNVAYKGGDILSFQPDGDCFTHKAMLQSVTAIQKFQPSMILSIGTRNFIADLFGKDVFTFMYPTGQGIPVTSNNYFMTWNNPGPEDWNHVEAERLQSQYLFAMHPGFEPPAKMGEMSRKQFDIPENAFVILVIGARLGAEIDDSFIRMMTDISQEEKAFFVFVGHFNGYKDIFLAEKSLSERHCYIGFQQDISSVMTLGDAYINPKRRGGGSVIIYAMAHSLPALSLPYGDAYEAVKNLTTDEDFKILNYQVMAQYAKRLITDTDFYTKWSSMCAKEASRLTSRRPLVKRILDCHTAYKQGNLKPMEAKNE